MFADPLSVTIGSDTFSLPRVETSGQKSVYRSNDQNVILEISHSTSGKGADQRVRSMVKLTHRKVVTDPITAQNDYDEVIYHSVTDRPLQGFTVTEVQNLVYGYQTFLNSTNVAKIYGTES
jgi:hypothetical protein